MRRLLLALIGLLIAAGAHDLAAQAPARSPATAPVPAGNGEVRGIIVDLASSAPISRASVAVRVKGQAQLLAGAIATPDGAFRVQGLRPGTYTLRATYLGFGPRVADFTVSDAAPIANVGRLTLTRVAVELEGVAVKEERAAVTIEPDRNAYRAKDVAPAASNASDVLDAVPSVQVDADGKVSLRGNENVAVQINGRPSPIRGAQLGAYLKSMPASVVDRVEVIPNPSARYDPEGMAGIINIVLKQNADLGLSGGVTAGAANAERFNGSGNVGYQSGPLTLFTNLGINKDERPVVGINDRERFDALSAPLSFTEQDIDGRAGNHGVNLNATVDYRLGKRDVLSNAFIVNRRGSSDVSASAYSELGGDRALLARYDRLRDLRATGTMFDYTMALKRTFEARKHELSGEVRFNQANDDERTALWKQPNGADATSGSLLDGERDAVDARSRQLAAQVDYTRTLAPRRKLETGYKGTARWLDRDYRVSRDALGNGDWVVSNLSNAFTFDEKVNAAYGVLSQGAGKFELQAGLRAEIASRDFTLAASATSYPVSYRSLFPSGAVMYNLSDATQLKASYSRRIRRPGTQELNPFPTFFDVQNVFIGNPRLDPEYTDALELGVTRAGALGSLQVSPFYRHTSNVIRVLINTADVIDGRDVTSVSFQNLAASNSWGTDLNGSLRLGKRLTGFAGVNVFKMVTDGGSTSAVGSDAVTWSTRLNGTTEITPNTILQAMYFYRAPMKIEGGRFASMQMTNVVLKRKIDGDRSSVSLRVTDPFNTGRMRIQAGDENINQITERSFGARAAYLTFQYNYGQAPRVRQPQQEPQPQQAGFP